MGFRPQPSSQGGTMLAKNTTLIITGDFEYDQNADSKNQFVWYPAKTVDQKLTGYISSAYITKASENIIPALSFTDVAGNYQDAVDYLVSKGINGTSPTTFGTYDNIKRVDAAIFVAKALNLNLESAPTSGFTDVPDRAVKYVNALKAAGITSGKTTTTLDSYAEITRGELAMWIQKGFDLKADTNTIAFTDVAPKYTEAVSALVSNKITSGTSATTFGTKANAKRGDFAIFLYKAEQAQS